MRRLGPALALLLVAAASPAATATDDRAVARPTNFSVVPGYAMAHLSWDWAKDDDTTYRVFRATSATGPWKRITSLPVASYDLEGLTNGTKVWFSVASVLDGRQSARSAPIGVTPDPAYQLSPTVDVVGYAFTGYPARAYSPPAISADGKRVAFAYEHLGWYDAGTGRTKNLKLHSTYDLAMDDTGRFLALSQYHQGRGVTDPRFRAALIDWNTKDVTELGAGAEPAAVDISADGRYVAWTEPTTIGTADAFVLDRVTGETRSFTGADGVETGGGVYTQQLALSSDGSTVALATNATIDGAYCYNGSCAAIWDLADGTVRSVPAAGNVQGLALSADGSRLATSGLDARVIDLGPVADADQVVWQSDALHAGLDANHPPSDYTAAALTRDGSAVAYYTSDMAGARRVGTLHVRDLSGGETHTQVVPVASLLPSYRAYRSQSGAGAVFTADGRYVFSQQATKPGATPDADPRRADIVRWDWALTAPDA